LIRDEPVVRAVYDANERRMARQRADLAARLEVAPLDLGQLHT
jgi:hypothetical protein